MNQLTYQDVVAIGIAAGIKLGGGDWKKALLWGFGSRFVMGYIGFPSNDCIPQGGQSAVQSAGAFFQRIFGQMPVGVGTASQPAAQGPVIDAQFETHTPSQQQVPTPG